MSNTQVSNLILRDDDFPLLTETVLTQEFLEKNGDVMPLSRLAQLKVALDALQPIPPNATTVWFDNTILLQDALITGGSNVIDQNHMEITDVSGNTSNLSVSNLIINDLTGFNMDISATNIVIADTSGNIGNLSRNLLIMTDVSANNSTLNTTSLQLSSTTNTTTYDNSSITTNNNYSIINPNKSTKIGDPNGTASSTYVEVSDNTKQIRMNVPDYYGRTIFQCGLVLKVVNISTTSGNHILPNATYYISDSIDPYLYPVSTYYSTETRKDGFTFYIANCNSTTITMTSDDGKDFYSFLQPIAPTLTILGYVTAQVTLVYLDSLGDYIWSVK